jgi:hypothetical protein
MAYSTDLADVFRQAAGANTSANTRHVAPLSNEPSPFQWKAFGVISVKLQRDRAPSLDLKQAKALLDELA